MSRRAAVADRLATLLLALAALAVAAAAWTWWRGTVRLPGGAVLGPVPDRLDAGPAGRVLEQGWWPPAALGAGLLLVLAGLAVLAAHLPRRGPDRLALAGSSAAGRLGLRTGPLADAAAAVLAGTPGVRRAGGSLRPGQDGLELRLRATVEPDVGLGEVAAAADRVAEQLAGVTGRDDVTVRVRLGLAGVRRRRSRP